MTVCFDIGGSAIKAALARSPNDLRDLGSRVTPTDDFEAFCRAIDELAASGGAPTQPLSIAIAGVVDPSSGRITCANVPCANGRRLAEDLSAALARPVHVTNDADCFALAEAGAGAGRGHRVVFGVILGTGVGGGLVVSGRLVEGAGGFAGEWGHAPILAKQAGDPPVDIPWFACGCGQRGCIDTIGGARGLERLHTHLTGETWTSIDIMDAWRVRDPRVAQTLACYVELVAQPLAFCVNVVGADIVPVGGGLGRETALLEALDESVRARILRRSDEPLVVPARCTGNGGLVGAALAAQAGRM
ncbi:ROK family protein [Pararhizobium mangrovi]|uniref:N-acetylglucosamine kinase n=1 Tax=Pararhizobium mangrovi TaxID=2590452 RepID=A0A506TYJ0_9HYPH|nr:ROK family protein [Pararhizobium mangrovi]TPW27142.1 ROK family protein [Pararhizobium mangrovi]